MNAIEVIRIGEDEIQGIRTPDGSAWVVVSRACGVLGMDFEGQRQKLRDPARSPWATTCVTQAVAEDGKVREVFCLHADSVPMWLATIDASRCALYVQAKIVLFQREAAKVLAAWAYGRPIAPAAPPASLDLRDPAALRGLLTQLAEINLDYRRQLAEKTEAIAVMEPKARAWAELADTTGTVCITEAGKTIGVNPILFHRWLEVEHHVYRRGRSVLARQDHLDAGRMVERSVVVGDKRYTQTRITSKGVCYFKERCPDLRPARRAPLPRQHGTPLALALPGSLT